MFIPCATMQKMEPASLRAFHQLIHGLVLLRQEKVLIWLHLEQQMVLFAYGLFNLIQKGCSHCLTCHWYL
jgi:hypothetical protein